MSPNKLLRNLTSPGFGFGPTKLQRCLRLIRQGATLAVAMYVCVYIYIHIYIKHAQTSCGFARLGLAKNPKVSSALEAPCRRAKSSHHADLLKGFLAVSRQRYWCVGVREASRKWRLSFSSCMGSCTRPCLMRGLTDQGFGVYHTLVILGNLSPTKKV